MSDYVELHARSAFSFLRGASSPEELAKFAAALDLPGIAICDRDGVYGSARAHGAAKEVGIRSFVGAELTLEGGSVLPVLVKERAGYQNLCQLITRSKLRGTKTECAVRWDELPEFSDGLIALVGHEDFLDRGFQTPDPTPAAAALDRVVESFGKSNVCVELQRHHRRPESRVNELSLELARSRDLPVIATNGVLHSVAEQRGVLDVMTCIRNHTDLDRAGRLLSPNSERHLKPDRAMRKLFADLPEAVENTARIAERLEFSLEDLGYEFPTLDVPDGETMPSWLRKQTYAGATKRYGTIREPVRRQLERELDLIIHLGFAGYFLIVWDLVQFCRRSNILVQGRGSAANSVVCYCLGITACDPIHHKLLFERFLSESRKSWPDIDLDLPSGDRRERVIQEVYRRYGKHGAAMTANVITYRGKSAMREIGKALNLPLEVIDRFSRLHAAGDFPHTLELRAQLEQAGLPITHPRSESAITLYQRLRGLPRHLGQHSGGMIICRGALSSVVPLENASMPGRVVAQWDKDDCEDLGIIKVDLLGLGMMAVMQDSLEMCSHRRSDVPDMAAIPPDDPATYDLMCAADTIGTFQVESRAQIATLPKLKPRRFYDVVIQVAVIRPGPIQGGMLAPLFARRAGEPFKHIHPLLEETLERTYGVPLFQEQLLKMAMVMADFTGGEAEELRRALSFHRSHERMEKVCLKLRSAMADKGIEPDVADTIVQSVQSFAVYGFPESHAISFALIAYASCWLKVHRAPEFYAALLNNQPMGFYSAATLVQDAKHRGLHVRPVSVLTSDVQC
ncbi:MAG: error-prone DNA polymerase, partial [Chthoniobacterales bacterium]